MDSTKVKFISHFAGQPALGILEFDSIARGIRTMDAVVKKAPITMLLSRPVSGGKHIFMFRGGVAEVNECMAEGRDIGGERLLDHLELPFAHTQIWSFLPEPIVAESWGDGVNHSVAIFETQTVCANIHGADAALKAAEVRLQDMRLALGIAGRAFFTITGELEDLQVAMEAAQSVSGNHFIHQEIIPAPASEINGKVFF